MSKRCNGTGDCDSCHNMNCREWLECDICGEFIYDSTYISTDEGEYHTDCFLERYEVTQ